MKPFFRCIIVMLILTVSGAVQALDISEYLEKLETSKNAEKKGSYICDTQNGTYKYYVYVPSTYSKDNPAGLHVYFHGQNGQSGAKWFGNVDKLFLEKYNLIGINMQYNDGDNFKDTQGKVEAAKLAIAQTMLDYSIVAGRGAVTCFSGGGGPTGLFFSEYGVGSKERGINWPFCHISLYSSSFRTSLSSLIPMTVYIAVGEQEWSQHGFGDNAKRRTAEALTAMNKHGAADVWFEVTPGKGHKVLKHDIELASDMFGRSDTAFGHFICMKYIKDKTLIQIAEAANNRQFTRAVKALKSLLKKRKLDPAVRSQAQKIAVLIDKKVKEIIDLTKKMAQNDLPFASQYGKLFMTQLRGLPQYKEFSKIMAGVQKNKTFLRELKAHDTYLKSFPTFFSGGARINDTMAEAVEGILKDCSPTSNLGKLMNAYLELKQDGVKKPKK